MFPWAWSSSGPSFLTTLPSTAPKTRLPLSRLTAPRPSHTLHVPPQRSVLPSCLLFAVSSPWRTFLPSLPKGLLPLEGAQGFSSARMPSLTSPAYSGLAFPLIHALPSSGNDRLLGCCVLSSAGPYRESHLRVWSSHCDAGRRGNKSLLKSFFTLTP